MPVKIEIARNKKERNEGSVRVKEREEEQNYAFYAERKVKIGKFEDLCILSFCVKSVKEG